MNRCGQRYCFSHVPQRMDLKSWPADSATEGRPPPGRSLSMMLPPLLPVCVDAPVAAGSDVGSGPVSPGVDVFAYGPGAVADTVLAAFSSRRGDGRLALLDGGFGGLHGGVGLADFGFPRRTLASLSPCPPEACRIRVSIES